MTRAKRFRVRREAEVSPAELQWLTGLPQDATIITVGQGYVQSGTRVNAVPEQDAKTAVAIQAGGEAQD